MRATPGHAGQDVVFKTVQQIGVELAVDAFEISVRIDHLVLLSSDGDLRALVEAVQRRGVRVTVVSIIKTRPRWSQRLGRPAQPHTGEDDQDIRVTIRQITEATKRDGGRA